MEHFSEPKPVWAYLCTVLYCIHTTEKKISLNWYYGKRVSWNIKLQQQSDMFRTTLKCPFSHILWNSSIRYKNIYANGFWCCWGRGPRRKLKICCKIFVKRILPCYAQNKRSSSSGLGWIKAFLSLCNMNNKKCNNHSSPLFKRIGRQLLARFWILLFKWRKRGQTLFCKKKSFGQFDCMNLNEIVIGWHLW